MKKKDLLLFVYLALRDSKATTKEELIKLACQYGGSLKVSEDEIKNVLNMRLIDFMN